MEQERFTTVILTASEGHKLTQVADVDAADRLVASRVCVAAGGSADDWHEVTDEEAAVLEAAAKEARQATMKERAEARRAALGLTPRRLSDVMGESNEECAMPDAESETKDKEE